MLLSDERGKQPEAWSADGRFLAYQTVGNPQTFSDIWILPLSAGAKPFPFVQTPFVDLQPRFSPDGRWLAYASNESGQYEVYVTNFPDRSGEWQVSTTGGNWPRWRRDGKEIFFVSPDNRLNTASVAGGGADFRVAGVQPLFDVRARLGSPQGGSANSTYAVTADGARFLVNTLVEEGTPDPLTLIVNWPALLTGQ